MEAGFEQVEAGEYVVEVGEEKNATINHGRGRFDYDAAADEGWYDGRWKDDERHGRGTRHFTGGPYREYKGELRNNDAIDGKFTCADGDVYEGK